MTTPPVQSTNVLRVLHDHLWPEVVAVEARIAALEADLAALRDYREILEAVAEVADIGRPVPEVAPEPKP